MSLFDKVMSKNRAWEHRRSLGPPEVKEEFSVCH